MKLVIKQLLREALNETKFLFKEESEIESCDCCKYFDLNNDNTSGGLDNPLYFLIEKNKSEQLKFITPEDYFKAIAKGFGTTYDEAINSQHINKENVKKYAEAMKNGVKFKVGYYTEKSSNQEGRHRALALMLLGCKIMPIIVFKTLSDNEVFIILNSLKNMSRIELDNEFKKKGYNGISDLDYSTFLYYMERNEDKFN